MSAKLSLPSVFWSLIRKEQWSVEIADSWSVRTASHRIGWFDLSRTGGEKTAFAPSKFGLSRYVSSMKKYCVHVSPHTGQPSARARAIGSTASLHVTCTTYSGLPATWASWMARFVASPSSCGGRVFACQRGSRFPSAIACLTRMSIASPFSPWIIVSAPVSRASCMTLNSVSSSTMRTFL